MQSQQDVGLDRYCAKLARSSLLGKAEELALAREIEQLEIARWSALLSFRPALELTRSSLAQTMPGGVRVLDALLAFDRRRPRAAAPARAARRSWNEGVERAAAKLRALDRQHSALRATEAAVRRALADTQQAQPYLARVSRAARAHESAKARFVQANLRLVVHLAQRYSGAPLAKEDLVQEGNIGLMRAVERFDHRRGLRFSTYATWWIRHHIQRAIADKARLIRVPNHALESLLRMERATQTQRVRTGETPSPEALAQAGRVSSEMLGWLQSSAGLAHPRSLDSVSSEDGKRALHETLADTQTDAALPTEREEQRLLLRKALRELSEFEASILHLHFGLDGGQEQTLHEIGEKYRLSRERIRQIEALALGKLRVTLAGEHSSSS